MKPARNVQMPPQSLAVLRVLAVVVLVSGKSDGLSSKTDGYRSGASGMTSSQCQPSILPTLWHCIRPSMLACCWLALVWMPAVALAAMKPDGRHMPFVLDSLAPQPSATLVGQSARGCVSWLEVTSSRVGTSAFIRRPLPCPSGNIVCGRERTRIQRKHSTVVATQSMLSRTTFSSCASPTRGVRQSVLRRRSATDWVPQRITTCYVYCTTRRPQSHLRPPL